MRWQLQATGTTEKLLGVWCGACEVLAVGEHGALIRRGAGDFERLESGTSENLYAIDGSAETVVVVGGNLHVGGSSLLLHRRAEGFVAEPSGMQHILLTVTHASGGWLAAGYNGAILRGAPGRWVREELAHHQHVFASCSIADRTFVAGLGGSVLEHRAGSWRPHHTGVDEHIRAIAADGQDHVIAVGLGGLILRFDGARWQRMPSPTQVSLEGVHVARGHAFAVGQDGVVLHDDGSGWRSVERCTDENLFGVHGHGSEFVAVGARGVACRLTW